MADVSSVVKHFPVAKEGFVTTLASTVSSGAATVPLNSVTGYANGDVAVFIVDPGNGSKQAFTGTIDTAGVQVTSVKWTEGTNVSHNAGATVVDYVAATHMSMVTKGLLVEHDQDGTHGNITGGTATFTGAVTAPSFVITGAGGDQGWLSGLPAPDTVTYNGNRSYDLVFNSTDLTDTVNVGMRLRTTRTVTAPIQCADLEASSTQYFNDTSVAGTTFTDDFCAGGWIKMESYAAGAIVSRYNGTSGWIFYVNSSGRPTLVGFNAGSSNSSQVITYQSIPLNKWVHVAGQLDMSAFTATTTTSYIMIDGVDVPCTVSRGGTNPTALVQAGNLEVGAYNAGTDPFDGKLSNVWYSSAKITQANQRLLSGQAITSALCTTHSIVSAYTLNNTLNDVNTTSANNLTAQGSAVATNADSPFALGADLASAYTDGTVDFSIVTKAVFSTNTTLTVQVAEGCTLPTSGGISAVVYSSEKVPYGMPTARGRWKVLYFCRTQNQTSINNTTAALTGALITLPVGDWILGESGAFITTHAGLTNLGATVALSTSTSSMTNDLDRTRAELPSVSASMTQTEGHICCFQDYSVASQTVIYVVGRTNNNQSVYYGATTHIGFMTIEAELATA